MTFGIRSTLIGSFVILAVLACTLTLSALFLVNETEKRFQFLGEVTYPPSNQSSVYSELTLGQAIVILISDSSQSELRDLLLDAATDTLGDVPAVGPAAVGLAVSISGIVAVVVLMSRNVSSPFQKLLLAAKAVARGNYYVNLSRTDTTDGQGIAEHYPTRKDGLNLKDSGKDELSQLFAIFREINAALLQQKRELEATNEELATKIRELAESNQKLKALDKMKSEFISIASHELRNPVQPILGCIRMARKGLVSGDQAMDIVENEAIRLKDLAQSILDVSRIESGQFIYEMRFMNM
ncbi:MAG: histidine kinase dimerization/phospho-acceptor domain-containing protein, partial [Nitrososphaerales archaeon]